MLKLENVTKQFSGQLVLNRLSLEIHDREILVIVGPSGAGKSVLLKILVTLLDPDEGKIQFDHTEITGFSQNKKASLCSRFGMLFQDAALFDSMTVRENVGFALSQKGELDEEQIDKIVLEKLSMVGMSHVMDHMPADLSGGMKKRVGLAHFPKDAADHRPLFE